MRGPDRNLAKLEPQGGVDGGRIPAGAGDLVPEIRKLQGYGKFMGANRSDNGLQFVTALAIDTYLVALNLRGDLEFAVPNEPGDLLGHIAGDPLLDFNLLPGVAKRGDVRVA